MDRHHRLEYVAEVNNEYFIYYSCSEFLFIFILFISKSTSPTAARGNGYNNILCIYLKIWLVI